MKIKKYLLIGNHPVRAGYPGGPMTDEKEAIKWAEYFTNSGYPVDVEVIEEEPSIFDNHTLY